MKFIEKISFKMSNNILTQKLSAHVYLINVINHFIRKTSHKIIINENVRKTFKCSIIQNTTFNNKPTK